MRDLALIYAAYLARLHQPEADHRDLMEKLLERLEESGYAAGKDVYLDGFTYFTAQEMQLISILLRTARSVTVTLLGDGSGQEIFQQAVRTRDRLERLAAANVKNVSLTTFDVIAQVAAEENYIRPEDIARLIAFRDDPSDESWIGGGK